MLFDPKHGQYLGKLEAELRRAQGLTPELMSEVMTQACGCFAPHEQAAIRGISRLIEAGACVDAVLAMIALELPQWKLRRVLYEDGEWHCSLSSQPQLPIELDEVAEGSHETLPLAVLIALLRARRDPTGREGGASAVPPVNVGAGYTMYCEFCLIHEPADRDVNVSAPAMRQPKPTFAHEVDSRHVLFRFAFRLIVLTIFASLSTRGFGPAFAALLAMAALFCAIAGAMRREEMLGHVLTHWDEAAAYAVIARLASTLS